MAARKKYPSGGRSAVNGRVGNTGRSVADGRGRGSARAGGAPRGTDGTRRGTAAHEDTNRRSRRPTNADNRPHPRGANNRRPKNPDGNWITRAIRSVDAVTSTPRLDYIVMWCLTIFLTGFGLLMVLSSSTATSYQATDSPWASFLKQAGMAMVGLVAMWLVLKVKPATIRTWSAWGMGLAFVLLVLVLIPGIGVGLEETGSQSWLAIGPITLQPSEVAKLAVAVWGSAELAKKAQRSANIREVFGRFTLVVLGVVLAVTLERDLGMVASVMIVFLALAWFVGLPKWVATVIGIGGLVLATGLILTAGFRSTRIVVWQEALLGKFTNVRVDAWQSYQGFLSLGDGSLTGQGLGQSRAKWFYLPEAKNDFIFAIIGEELGFIGAGIVILCFALLGWFGIKIAVNQADPFLRLMAATITTGIVIQAFINIGYVVGLLPVTGIQLPLISSGGTSVIITLISMGLLLNCARHEPETISSMQSYGRPLIDKILRLPEPEPYTPESTHISQAHRRVQRFGEPIAGRRDAWGTHRDGAGVGFDSHADTGDEEAFFEDGTSLRGRRGLSPRGDRSRGESSPDGTRRDDPRRDTRGRSSDSARSRGDEPDRGRGGRRTAQTSAVRKSARQDATDRDSRGRGERDVRGRVSRGRDRGDDRDSDERRDYRGSREPRERSGYGTDSRRGPGPSLENGPTRRGRLSFEREDR